MSCDRHIANAARSRARAKLIYDFLRLIVMNVWPLLTGLFSLIIAAPLLHALTLYPLDEWFAVIFGAAFLWWGYVIGSFQEP